MAQRRFWRLQILEICYFVIIANPEAGRPVGAGVWSGPFDGGVPKFYEGVQLLRYGAKHVAVLLIFLRIAILEIDKSGNGQAVGRRWVVRCRQRVRVLACWVAQIRRGSLARSPTDFGGRSARVS